MADIALTYSQSQQTFDFEIINGQLVQDDTMGTAILMQLFSSSVQVGGYVPWFGNSYQSTPVGSGLPNLLKGVRSGNTSILVQAQNIVQQAMQPFVALGLISNLVVPLPAWSRASGVSNITIQIIGTLAGQNSPITYEFGFNSASGAAWIITP